MTSSANIQSLSPHPLVLMSGEVSRPLARFGHMAAFFVHAALATPVVLRRYRREFLRLLSDITWGNGSIVVGGGTVGVVLVLGISVGALVAIEGYNFLNVLGLGPATGVVSSLVTTRELAPIMVALGFAIQAGCRFTTQLGSMRMAEEIDALNAMAIRPIPYLVTTRLLASVVAIVPLYVACLAISYLSCQAMVSFAAGGSVGPYLHYFTLMISGKDIVYSTVKVVIFVALASTVQCYYGFCARGGPEGVGIAAGHAMRASITVVIIVNMLLTMTMWSADAGVRFGG
jgi:phospholipid/cholesterol/gamma-HCH transport system permease protein